MSDSLLSSRGGFAGAVMVQVLAAGDWALVVLVPLETGEQLNEVASDVDVDVIVDVAEAGDCCLLG